MKRKLIDAFDKEEQKFPRYDPVVVDRHLQVASQHPESSQPMPTDVDLHNVMRNFVNIYEKLDQTDEPLEKPNYSYTELVYLAILRSPNFCLPIGEIYKYVQNRFAFFRNNARVHWRNAIRHSLSKTKCFTKICLGRGANGSSNRSCFLWSIVPSSIINFARGDYRPNVDRDSGTNTLRWGYYHTNAGNFWDQVAIVLENKTEFFKAAVANCSTPNKVFQLQVCDMPNPHLAPSSSSLQNAMMSQSTAPVTRSPMQQQSSEESRTPPNVVCQPNGTIYAAPPASQNTPSYTTASQSTPPPNVVCQPKGALCSNSMSTVSQSTPPPNVVCQPNGTLFSSSTPSVSQSTPPPNVVCQPNGTFYSSSKAAIFQAAENQSVDSSYSSSPIFSDCSRSSNSFTSPSALSYDIGSTCYQSVSPPPSSTCMQSTPQSTQRWLKESPQLSTTSHSSFNKDSGLELSCSDLESFQESISEWIPLYQDTALQADQTSYTTAESNQGNTDESLAMTNYINHALSLGADNKTESVPTESQCQQSVPTYGQAYNYITVPQYNFGQQSGTTAGRDQVFVFNASTNTYHPIEWYQS